MKKRTNDWPRKLALALTLAIALCALAGLNAGVAGAAEKPSPRKFIIDTDTGADDASALILAAKSPDVEIVGVTVLAGNVDLEQAAKNALASLEIAGCDAPVYKGSDTRYDGEAIEPHSVFGADGMGEKDLIHPKGEAREGDAIDFILDAVRSNPGEIEIVMLGPATNIAKAMDRDPETMKNVKMIWSMGTSGITGMGNATPVSEFNVFLDAPAYRKLLDFGVPVTVVGLDMCGGESMWTDDQFELLAESGDIGRFVADSFSVIRRYYAENGFAGLVANCDGATMMCAVCPDFVEGTIQCHGSCITEPGETYAEVLFYRQGFTYDLTAGEFDYNVTLVSDLDRSNFFFLYLERIAAEGFETYSPECNLMLTVKDGEFDRAKLIQAAIDNQVNSYAPYSNYNVSAAVLMDSGVVYTGVNVENASYPAGICAEQNAIAHAAARGERRIVAIAIVGGSNYEVNDYCAPCGICRQVMREFCDPKEMRVIFAKSPEDYREMSLEELLPESFGPDALEK